MAKANQDLRQAMIEAGVRQWQVADKMLMSEVVFCRKMRKEFDDRMKKIILEAIEVVKQENMEGE